MDYRFITVIELKTTFSRISTRCGFMNEHMVPRLILVRLGFIGSVPFFIGHEPGVARHYQTAVLITDMENQITWKKPRRFES